MRRRSIAASLFALVLVLALCAETFADTIRLRDGSVIRGQIVAFRDQQFTVLIGSGARGRRSRITLYMEDVESIEFDAASATTTTGSDDSGNGNSSVADNDTGNNRQPVTPINQRPAPAETTRPTPARRTNDDDQSRIGSTITQPTSPTFFQINVRVRADNTANGWTNSGLVVRRGQRLRVSSSGRVSLGNGQFSTPTGLPRLADASKLMRNEPTGGLIAVIGDDNDEFIFIGSNREFNAPRDGILFLGVNESNLNDNTGVYDTTIEAEAVPGGQTR